MTIKLFKEKDSIQWLLVIFGLFAFIMFVTLSIREGEIAAEYFSAVIATVVGYITYQVAKSADKSAGVALKLQERAHALEERNEAPYVVPMLRSVPNPYSQGYVSASADRETNSLFVVLTNQGSGPAFEIMSDDMAVHGTACKIPFLKVGDTFPILQQNNRELYPAAIKITSTLPNDDAPNAYSIIYKDAHDMRWRTVFEVVLERGEVNQQRPDIINGTLRLATITREKIA